MRRCAIFVCLLGACLWPTISGFAQESVRTSPVAAAESSAAAPLASASDPSATHSSSAISSDRPSTEKAAIESGLRIEGEKRFRTNCGRCHMPPHKFPPRVMATAIRHMRVRATLTDEDMRLILHYMTQ
jgi:mono/diheme cytochrome c family protein